MVKVGTGFVLGSKDRKQAKEAIVLKLKEIESYLSVLGIGLSKQKIFLL